MYLSACYWEYKGFIITQHPSLKDKMEGFLFYFSQEEIDALENPQDLSHQVITVSRHVFQAPRLISLRITHQWKTHAMAEKLHPSLCDRHSLKNYGAWSNYQIRRRASVWEACFASHQRQRGEDVWKLRVSKSWESGYLAIWQDDSAHVSGSAGEPGVIEAAFWQLCFWRKLGFFWWNGARIPMRGPCSSRRFRKDVLPAIFNQHWKFSFHSAGSITKSRMLDNSNVYFKPGSHRQEIRVWELVIFFWYLQVMLEMEASRVSSYVAYLILYTTMS